MRWWCVEQVALKVQGRRAGGGSSGISSEAHGVIFLICLSLSGLDFGGVNTAGIFFAQERDAYHKPTGRRFAYREYRAGGTARRRSTATT